MESKILDRVNAIKIAEDLKNFYTPVIPRRDKVILKKVDTQRTTASGLIIAEINKSNRPLGRVIAFGPDCAPDLRKGLLVVFDPSFDFPLVVDGIDYIMLNDGFIDAIIEDEQRVVIPVKPVTGAEIKRVERHENVTRVRKQNAVDYENKMDELQEKSKDRAKKPVTSKYKRK